MKKLLFCSFLLLSFFTAQSQKLNFSSSIGGSYTAGNFNSYSLNSQTSIGQDSTLVAWNLSPTFVYGRIFRDEAWNINQREAYLTSSLSYRKKRHRVICFSESENSFLKKIDYRGTLGLGYGNEIVNRDKFRILVSEAIVPEIYTSEIYINRNLTSVRLSTRLKIEYQGKVKLSSTLLFQPSFWSDRSLKFEENINARFNSSVDFSITKFFSISFLMNAYMSTFSTYVDSNVNPVDYNFSLSVKYKN